jgi:type II restriction/modification system DNA methylase subunit YeeA
MSAVVPQQALTASTACNRLHVEPRSGMRRALTGLNRYIGTARHSKHRLFVWLPVATLPDSALIVFARDDDVFFGVLHSHPHEIWALATGTQVRERESGFRYTPSTTFETFPFPACDQVQSKAIGGAAKALDTFRQGWLNPADALPHELKNRTLTNRYNERPTWLAQAHERLDRAVHAAYGWAYPLAAEDVLTRLLTLNMARHGGPGPECPPCQP